MNQDVTSDTTVILPGSMPSPSSKKPRQSRQMHGFTGLLKGRYKADSPQLDGRCTAAQLMNQYRAELLASLGGSENLSAQELTIVEICCRDRLYLETIDAYLLQAGIFNKKRKQAYALTTQRMAIADSLTRRLQALGLSKRAKPTKTLAAILAGQTMPPEQNGGSHE